MANTTRSPNYPRIDLSQAIEKIKKIYEKETFHAASPKVIAEDLGYSGVNGASTAVVSALKKYELLVSDGGNLKLSDDAITILESPSETEKGEAIRRCAFAPDLFEELYQTYGDNPPSEANLRHELIKKKFNPKKADEVIRIYRDTLFFVAQNSKIDVSLESKPIQEIVETSSNKFSPDVVRTVQYQFQKNSIPAIIDDINDENQELKFRISEDSEAKVIFRGEVTQEAIEKLIKLLDISKDTFPRKRGLTQNFQKEDKQLSLLDNESLIDGN